MSSQLPLQVGSGRQLPKRSMSIFSTSPERGWCALHTDLPPDAAPDAALPQLHSKLSLSQQLSYDQVQDSGSGSTRPSFNQVPDLEPTKFESMPVLSNSDMENMSLAKALTAQPLIAEVTQAPLINDALQKVSEDLERAVGVIVQQTMRLQAATVQGALPQVFPEKTEKAVASKGGSVGSVQFLDAAASMTTHDNGDTSRHAAQHKDDASRQAAQHKDDGSRLSRELGARSCGMNGFGQTPHRHVLMRDFMHDDNLMVSTPSQLEKQKKRGSAMGMASRAFWGRRSCVEEDNRMGAARK